MWGRPEPQAIELSDLPDELVPVFERMLLGQEVALTRDGETVGTVHVAPVALEGVLLPRESERPDPERRDGVSVVATATRLSDRARERLSDELGDDYVVLDLLEAPSSADVLLTHPVSPQLLGRLRAMFPQARVVVAEIDDPELGVSCTGQIARLMAAGAETYLPPRSVGRLGQELGAVLEGRSLPAVSAGRPSAPQIGPGAEESAERT